MAQRRGYTIADVLGFGSPGKNYLAPSALQREVRSIPRGIKYQGAISPGRSTFSRKFAEAITPNTQIGNEYAGKIASLLDFFTATGAEEPLVQARGAAGRGDYGRAAFEGALGILSAIPGAGKVGSKAAREAAEAAAERGIITYHGSPFDFPKFDFSKMGTGQGAQSYGLGGYFTEAEGVAKKYRDELTGAINASANRAIRQTGDIDAAIARAKDRIDAYSKMDDDRAASLLQINKKELDQLLRMKEGGGELKGSMYQVKINASPEDFLDWDRPITEQPESVKRALQPFIDQQVASIEAAGQAARNIAKEQGLPDFEPKSTDKILSGLLGGDIISFAKLKNMTGIEDALRSSGVPGIKYKDAGSRGSSDVTRNYVVFDDALIDILKKYGIAIPAITGGGLLATQPQQDGGL